MTHRCPFSKYVPPCSTTVGSRLALRRHLVLVHQSDFKVCFDTLGRQYDEVIQLFGDELSKKVDTFRRAGRHRNKAVKSQDTRVCVVRDPASVIASESMSADAGKVNSVEFPELNDFGDFGEDFGVVLDVLFPSESGVSVLASAVDSHVQMSEVVADTSCVMDCMSVDAGSSSVHQVNSKADARTVTDRATLSDVGCSTDRPTYPNSFAVADMLTSLALAGLPMGALRLAFRAANLLGVDPDNMEARRQIETAAVTALQMERVISESLLRTLDTGFSMDPSGTASLAAITVELARRRSRRLESDGKFYGYKESEEPCLEIEYPVESDV